MNKSFSIIIPCYQTPTEQVHDCLMSIARQDFDLSKTEVILSQDGDFRDFTELDTRLEAIDLHICGATKNRGISHARNLAIKQARGEFVLLLDADDAIEPDCLSSFEEAIHDTSAAYELYFSNATKTGDDLSVVRRKIDSAYFFRLLQQAGRAWDNPIFHSIFIGHCLALKRDTLLAMGGFDEDHPCAEITNLVLRFFYHEYRFMHLPKYLYRYRDNHAGLSKRRDLNLLRARSIELFFQQTTNIPLDSVRFAGRVAPYFHSHFMLCAEGRDLRLPYVDYDAMRLIGDGAE